VVKSTQASFIVQFAGAICASILVLCFPRKSKGVAVPTRTAAPLWAYGGGVLGAVVVVLSNVTVAAVGIFGAVSLMIGGQVLSSRVIDHFGWLHLPSRRFKAADLWAILAIGTGTCLILAWKDRMAVPWRLMALVALLNGVLISLAAPLNSRLTQSLGAWKASLTSHWVGAVAMFTVLLATVSGVRMAQSLHGVPTMSYLGGPISACIVALYTRIVPRIGLMHTLLLIISGQMLTAGSLDFKNRAFYLLAVGMFLLLAGVYGLYAGQAGAAPPERPAGRAQPAG
jgi:uncharacterized membrane protein YdcZ (DUF606 family)